MMHVGRANLFLNFKLLVSSDATQVKDDGLYLCENTADFAPAVSYCTV